MLLLCVTCASRTPQPCLPTLPLCDLPYCGGGLPFPSPSAHPHPALPTATHPPLHPIWMEFLRLDRVLDYITFTCAVHHTIRILTHTHPTCHLYRACLPPPLPQHSPGCPFACQHYTYRHYVRLRVHARSHRPAATCATCYAVNRQRLHLTARLPAAVCVRALWLVRHLF